jgi:hypothetical protein
MSCTPVLCPVQTSAGSLYRLPMPCKAEHSLQEMRRDLDALNGRAACSRIVSALLTMSPDEDVSDSMKSLLRLGCDVVEV